MKTIYLVRHGEAENNVPTAIYVGAESKLTELGRRQAKLIGERATRLPIDVVIASTYVRAQETAAEVSTATRVAIESSDLFVERMEPRAMLGRVWNDAETQQIESSWVKTFFTRGERVLDGENYDDILERAKQALRYLEKHTASNILVVTHGFYLRILVAYVLFGDALTPEIFQKPQWGLRTKNTGISVLHFNTEDTHQKRWLSVWNDHSHLADA